MYRTATVVESTGTEALVLFPDLKIQKTAAVMMDLTIAPGDTVYVIDQGNLSNCLVIGVKQE